MKKGVSPVAAVVLLIAIAVVAAAGVWFWVAPMMTSTQTSDVVGKYQVTITNCRVATGVVSVSVRNIGTASTPSGASVVPVYNTAGTQVGNISLSSLVAGSYAPSVPVINETGTAMAGTYYIEDSNFAKTTFSC